MMKQLESIITVKDNALRIPCYIQPRASRSQISGIHDHQLKISITAPPVDGKANAELRRFMAGKLDIPKSSISIISGETGRRKILEIRQLSAAEFIRRII